MACNASGRALSRVVISSPLLLLTVKLSGSAPKSPGEVTSHREIVG